MSRTPDDDAMLAEIRASMARNQRTRAELAEHLGMGRGALQRRLSGEVAFRVPEVAAIARFLNVPVSVLYEPAAGSTPASV